jgi:small subunit ribosomal protein S6
VKEMARMYETIFIVDLELGEEAVTEHVEKFKTLIEKSATLEKIDEWGKRKLAYPINYKKEGYYVYSSEPEFLLELERIFKITEGILKYLIVRK